MTIGEIDVGGKLFLGHASDTHRLAKTLPIGKKSRIVARCIETEAADCEARIEGQSSLRGRTSLIRLADKCERGGEMEVRQGEIAIGLDAAA